jgi:hypothetical protein
MKRFYSLATVAVLIVAIALACAGSKNNGSSGPDVIVSPETIVLSDAQAAQATVGADTLTFPASGNDNLLKLHAGNVLVSGYIVESANVYGFLKKVVSVQQQGDQIVIATTDAALTDVFEKLNTSFTLPGPNTNSDLVDNRLVEPELGGSAQHSANISEDFSGWPLLDAGLVDVSVSNGNVSFDPLLTFTLDIERPPGHVLPVLEDFGVAMTGNFNVTAVLNAAIAGPVNLGISVPLITFYTRAWVVVIEGIPVVVLLTGAINFGGSVYAADAITVSGGVIGAATLDASVGYTPAGGWSTSANVSDSQWSYVGPDYDAYINAELNVSVGLGIDLRLYGTYGISWSEGPYLDLKFVKVPPCNYALTAGLSETIAANTALGPIIIPTPLNKTLYDRGEVLTSGLCCNVKKCPDGCCDKNSVDECQPGTTDAQCGTNATICANCAAAAENCVDQSCTYVPDDDTADDDDDDNDNDDDDDGGCSAGARACYQTAVNTLQNTCLPTCIGSSSCQFDLCFATCWLQLAEAAVDCGVQYDCPPQINLGHCEESCLNTEIACLTPTLSHCGAGQTGEAQAKVCAKNGSTCMQQCLPS